MPEKPIIYIVQENKTIETQDGVAYTRFIPVQADESTTKSKWKKYDWQVLLAIAVIIFSGGAWITKVEIDIRALKTDIDKLKDPNQHELRGLISPINEKLIKPGKKTSYGLYYDLAYPICEFNESSNQWKEIPRSGQFIEIVNLENKYKTYCMIIGSFGDSLNFNRILNVSKVVTTNLDFKGGVQSVKVHLLTEKEVKENKTCMEMRHSFKIAGFD